MNRTLITGADGYVGSRLAVALWRQTNRPLHLWVRASNSNEFESKLSKISAFFTASVTDWAVVESELRARQDRASFNKRTIDLHPRIRISHGELTEAEPFAEIDPQSIETIVHSAAITRFNVDEALAQSINVDGSSKLFRFARNCPNLTRFLFVSSIYASGLKAGEVTETALTNDHGFANHYEHSKYQCESLLLKYGDQIPWNIARVATIVADDEAGGVGQYNAVHNTLKLFNYGMLSLVPGTPESPLYFVTGQFTTECLMAIMDHAPRGRIFHVSPEYEEALRLKQFIDTAFNAFSLDPSFQKRRILPPLYSDFESFKLLADSMVEFGQAVMSQASSSISPFARQLFVDKQVRNPEMRALLAHYPESNMELLVANMCKQLINTKWGRAVEIGVS